VKDPKFSFLKKFVQNSLKKIFLVEIGRSKIFYKLKHEKSAEISRGKSMEQNTTVYKNKQIKNNFY
jgi:hypothetical protein